MNSLKNLLNQDLLDKTKNLVKEERRIQVKILHHLLEIERRKLFLEIGYGSLFDYVVKDLGYSESAAYRRIQAMRLMKSVPELETKISEGQITLTTASQVQSFLKSEEKRHIDISSHDKLELIESVENKSTRDVEKYLFSMRPDDQIPLERIRQITEDHSELKLFISDEFREELDRLKLLLSHVNPEMSYLDLYKHLCAKELQRIEQKGLKRRSNATPAPEGSRYIPDAVRALVWKRDDSCCSFVNPESNQKCSSRFQVQIDHIRLLSQGGTNELSNLRLLCGSHNRGRPC